MVRDAQTVTAREDRKEYRRLLYVAMTRAADRLYVCGWHGKPEAPDESWYGLTARALAGEGDARPVDMVLPGGITGTGWRLTGEQMAAPRPYQPWRPVWLWPRAIFAGGAAS
ncbi:ATP-binding domain-containing protein [Tistrella bauzanensis]